LKAEDRQAISNFVRRYGAVEACALGFLFACSCTHSPQNIDFLQNSSRKDDGFLLYFAAIVEEIWEMDIIDEFQDDEISQGKFEAVKRRLETLLKRISQEDIKLKVKRRKCNIQSNGLLIIYNLYRMTLLIFSIEQSREYRLYVLYIIKIVGVKSNKGKLRLKIILLSALLY
jgi:hypothetical protein